MKPRESLAGTMLTLMLTFIMSCTAAVSTAAEPGYRHRAAITVTQPAAYVELALPVSAYAHSRQAGLADLRVVDALGNRVPFAVLPPRDNRVQSQEQLRPAGLYALPLRVDGAALASPLELLVQGDRISVRRLGATAAAPQRVPGWVIDLGERTRDQAAPQALRLAWAGTVDFSAAFDIDVSATLREWRAIGSGQLLALSAAAGTMVQRDVPLPADTPRFVRLVWRDAGTAPQLTGAQAVVARQTSEVLDAPTTLQLAPVAASVEPATRSTPATRNTTVTPVTPITSTQALHFDLGGLMPVVALDLELPPGNRVAPVRLQGRSRADDAWRDIGQSVFYRLLREGTVSRAPPVAINATNTFTTVNTVGVLLRQVRVLPDERSPALDPALTRLQVQVQTARLVFAAQGQPPFALLAGSEDAANSALPIGTLVPALADERPQFGRAELQAWAEQADIARAADAAERRAALRPGLLWAVLLAGVVGLAFMVWRLIKNKPTV